MYVGGVSGCEDVMVDNLCVENVVSVLGWGKEAHGSQWASRQAHHFLTEEFLQVAHSNVLHDLSKDYLKDLLSSDFLQVSSFLINHTLSLHATVLILVT